ncbi:MAG: VOC family protein [Syntrophaceae bacterium]|nr:VOC family protein [Syntrophaceae bacterium]
MIYFDSLLKADDFVFAVSSIAKDFREKFQFPDIHQLGIVVPDVETAAAQLEEKGMGPFFIASDTLDSWNERGKLRKFYGKVGIAYHKGLEIELLEPGAGSTFYKSCVDEGGRMVLQHLGFLVPDVDKRAMSMEKAGCATWVRGRIKAFPLVTDFAYMDTRDQAGIILEFINMKIFGFTIKAPAGIFHTIGRIEKMIGVRSLPF